MNSDPIVELEKLETGKLKKFTFKGIVTYAKCVANYDGDTVDIVFKYKNEFIKVNCRIIGIDTPELKSKNKKLKKLAYRAKQFLADTILNKVVVVHMLDFDKFGRVLVDIKTLETNHDIKNLIIEGGFGVPYDGNKRLSEDAQVIAYKLNDCIIDNYEQMIDCPA